MRPPLLLSLRYSCKALRGAIGKEGALNESGSPPTLGELKAAGFPLHELRNGGFTLKELKDLRRPGGGSDPGVLAPRMQIRDQ
jgi:hypothetical protein